MKTIILIRHGQSETNVAKVFTGQLDSALTDAGWEQARLMADYVEKYPIEKLYVSSLQRAIHTAGEIAKRQNCPMELRDDLREIHSGLWQGLCFEEIAERFPANYQLWRTDMVNAAPEGGETCRAFYDRVTRCLQEILQAPEQTVCLVCHATPIRMMESFILEKPAQEIPWVPNASVTVYTYDGGFQCIERGTSDFLGDLSSNLPKSI